MIRSNTVPLLGVEVEEGAIVIGEAGVCSPGCAGRRGIDRVRHHTVDGAPVADIGVLKVGPATTGFDALDHLCARLRIEFGNDGDPAGEAG